MSKLHILCVVAVCLSGCSNKDSQASFEIDVMAWNEQVEKFKAKIKNAATNNDPLAHRSNEDEAKRLEVERGKITGTESCIGGGTRRKTMTDVEWALAKRR